jgi:hypothetical protein
MHNFPSASACIANARDYVNFGGNPPNPECKKL